MPTVIKRHVYSIDRGSSLLCIAYHIPRMTLDPMPWSDAYFPSMSLVSFFPPFFLFLVGLHRQFPAATSPHPQPSHWAHPFPWFHNRPAWPSPPPSLFFTHNALLLVVGMRGSFRSRHLAKEALPGNAKQLSAVALQYVNANGNATGKLVHCALQNCYCGFLFSVIVSPWQKSSKGHYFFISHNKSVTVNVIVRTFKRRLSQDWR